MPVSFFQAYIHYFLLNKEMLVATLLSVHNTHTLEELDSQAQAAIFAGSYDSLAENFLANYH